MPPHKLHFREKGSSWSLIVYFGLSCQYFRTKSSPLVKIEKFVYDSFLPTPFSGGELVH